MAAGMCYLTLHDPQGIYNPLGGYRAAVLSDSPGGYWRLDETSGTLAYDSTGNNNNGLYNGGYTLNRPGATADGDGAVLFDGSTGYIDITSSSPSLVGPYSIEFWVELGAPPPGNQVIAGRHDLTGGRLGSIVYVTPTGLIQAERWATAGTITSLAVSTSAISIGSYAHVVATYDGTKLRIYINGNLDGSSGTDTTSQNAITTDFEIAASTVTPNFAGTIDEVAVYPTALSASRIQAHYAARLALGSRVQPMRPVTVTANYNGTTYGLYHGFISRAEHDPNPGNPQTTIECIDFFEWLQAAMPVIGVQVNQTVGQLITTILAKVGLSDPTYLDIATGGDLIPSWNEADGTKNALQLIQDLLVTDLGMFFIDGAGRATYLTRQSRYGYATSVGTITGDEVTAMKATTDKQYIVNQLTTTRQYSQQTVTIAGSPTGGTFTLTLDGQTTAAIVYNATAAQVQSALAALTNIGSTNVTCTGGALPGTAVVVQLTGQRNTMTAISSLTGGTNVTITINASTASSTAQQANNTASQQQYAQRAASAVTSANFASDSQAASMGLFLVALNNQPRPPAREMQFANHEAASMQQLLSLEVGQYAAFQMGNGGSQFNGTVHAIAHDINLGGMEHVATVTAQPNTNNGVHPFTVGTSVVGGPDVVTY